VASRHDHVRDVVGDRDGDQVLGHVQRDVAPPVHDAQVLLTGRHQVDRVPRFALGQGEREVRVAVEQVTDHRRHQPTHGRRERRDAQPARHPSGVAVHAGLELLEVREEA
jgi:hypothetical protein